MNRSEFEWSFFSFVPPPSPLRTAALGARSHVQVSYQVKNPRLLWRILRRHSQGKGNEIKTGENNIQKCGRPALRSPAGRGRWVILNPPPRCAAWESVSSSLPSGKRRRWKREKEKPNQTRNGLETVRESVFLRPETEKTTGSFRKLGLQSP